jgi:hypothetical protein
MTTQSGDILAWLYGSIRMHEEAAQAAAAEGTPHWREDSVLYGVRDTANNLVARSRDDRPGSVAHIALHDPAAVLRRCARARKLLELHGGQGHSCPSYDYDGDLDSFARFYNHEACPVVQNIAEGYGWTGGE